MTYGLISRELIYFNFRVLEFIPLVVLDEMINSKILNIWLVLEATRDILGLHHTYNVMSCDGSHDECGKVVYRPCSSCISSV